MDTKKIVSIVAVLAIVLGGLFMLGNKVSTPTTGGTFNPVKVDFAQGISVAGTTVISSLRAITAASLTVTGATTLGSTTAGVNTYRPIVTSTADTTLTASQTGTTFLGGTAGVDWTLPAVASSNGVHFRFAVSGNYATTPMTIVAPEGDIIEGSLMVAGAIVDCSANDLISISATNEDIGDFVDLYSNGTTWFIGSSNALAASVLTCTG